MADSTSGPCRTSLAAKFVCISWEGLAVTSRSSSAIACPVDHTLHGTSSIKPDSLTWHNPRILDFEQLGAVTQPDREGQAGCRNACCFARCPEWRTFSVIFRPMKGLKTSNLRFLSFPTLVSLGSVRQGGVVFLGGLWRKMSGMLEGHE